METFLLISDWVLSKMVVPFFSFIMGIQHEKNKQLKSEKKFNKRVKEAHRKFHTRNVAK